jgi:sulfane dehydrogenase subunit SoxC
VLYQNGERVGRRTGYPVRLLVPGFEGNMSVKWLRRLKLTTGSGDDEGRDVALHDPAERREGLAVRVPDGGQVVITRPAPGLVLKAPAS